MAQRTAPRILSNLAARRAEMKRRWSKVTNIWWTGRLYQVRKRKDYRWAAVARRRAVFGRVASAIRSAFA
jgi:hypothetical protein